jgi:hypothetical protein
MHVQSFCQPKGSQPPNQLRVSATPTANPCVTVGYTAFGNSMRSLALLRLVGGKDFWKSVRFGRHVLEFWNIDIFTCVLVGSEFL